MATLDPRSRRAYLDEAELAAAVLLLVAPEDPTLEGEDAREAVARLVDAGGVRDGKLEAWLVELVAPIARPELRALAESHSGGQLWVVASAWMAAPGGTLGTLAEGSKSELAPLDPALLPSALAREVGLAPRSVPGSREPLLACISDVEQAERERGHDPLGRLMAQRRCSWRVTVTNVVETRSLAVVDGGPQGYWLCELADAELEQVRLVPAASDEVASRLLALFAPTVGHSVVTELTARVSRSP